MPHPAGFRNRSAAGGAILTLAVGVAAVLAWADWRQAAHAYHWWPSNMSFGDTCRVIGVLAAKWLWTLVLPSAAGLLLALRGHGRVAFALVSLLLALTAAAAAIDLRVASINGNHAIFFAPFLLDPRPWRWVGGVEAMTPMLVVAILAGAATLAAAFALREIASRLGRRSEIGLLIAASVVWGLVLWSPRSAFTMERPAVLQRLASSFAFDVPGLTYVPRSAQEIDVYDHLNTGVTRISTTTWPLIDHPKPATVSWPAEAPHPHIAVIVVEGLRADALDPRWMPHVAAWAREGLTLSHHYANTNVTHLGLFALVYGLNPVAYDAVLDARKPATMPAAFRNAGYVTKAIVSQRVRWQRMDEFLSTPAFDEASVIDQPLVETDSIALAAMTDTLRAATRPTLVLSYLTTTHFPYYRPQSLARCDVKASSLFGLDMAQGFWSTDPVAADRQRYGTMQVLGPSSAATAEKWRCRYRESLSWIDGRLDAALRLVDLSRTVVVIVGDHGESLGEDGVWLHTSRLSDVQTRPVAVLRGPSIPRAVRDEVTAHVDVLPTLLHAAAGRAVPTGHLHGRDLLDADAPPVAILLSDFGHRQMAVIDPRSSDRPDLLVSEDRRRLYSRGFYDERGQLQPVDAAGHEPAAVWIPRIDALLTRLAR